jgi:glutamate--cysteine ligase
MSAWSPAASSSSPARRWLTMHDICEETGQHLDEVKTVADELGLGFLGLGLRRSGSATRCRSCPRAATRSCGNYMPKVGGLGLDMMLRTCTVQANLDFSSEADMVAKFRMSLALQPIATALFANSPFIEGKPNGFCRLAPMSGPTPTRPHGHAGFRVRGRLRLRDLRALRARRADVFRQARRPYIDLSGAFVPRLHGRQASGAAGRAPTIKDWADHTTTLFPEVRLKQYLEMRGADAGPWSRLCALPALWTGMFYDDAALAAAWDLCKDWDIADHERLRADTCRIGLKAQIAGRSMQDVAKDVLAIARQGLKARNRLSAGLVDETGYLNELDEIAESGITPAERLLELYNGPWAGDAGKAFEAFAY